MGFLDSIYSGIKSAGSFKPDWKYKDLETTPYLHGSEYLNEMYEDAKYDWQKEAVYDHMATRDVIDVGCEGYDRLHRKHQANLRRRYDD